ncbi:MAG: hypothetical protein COB20_10290 [SAR86 cluster bacterium]|uniref:Uncharacterized protein n=1 Tax=SAR86 cluster bacterium TaxID=2030880 RepID=A0A2A4X250_9GAMM|nr:MAG: hypothetical protein COB20_10290 [SAR86 cluster bacterium]
MRKLLLFALLSFCQFTIAAENDPPAQDVDLQEAAQVEADSSIETQEDGSDLVAAEILDTNEDEEESSVRFIPTEEISQDFGVSFPVDI